MRKSGGQSVLGSRSSGGQNTGPLIPDPAIGTQKRNSKGSFVAADRDLDLTDILMTVPFRAARSIRTLSPGFSRVFGLLAGRAAPDRQGLDAKRALPGLPIFPPDQGPGCKTAEAAPRVGDSPLASPVLEGLFPAHCRSG
jgi:hypothetical protein